MQHAPTTPPAPAQSRRAFLRNAAASVAGAAIIPGLASCSTPSAPAKPAGDRWFEISLAEWSFHQAIFGKHMTNLDFPRVARRDFDISAVEYVNQFWMDKAADRTYLAELQRITAGEGVRNVLMMCDDIGNLGDPDVAKRREAAANHRPWADAARFLGCHAIRVNAYSEGNYAEQQDRAADGLRLVAEYGANIGLNVIVENHGGLSSNGQWLTGVIRKVNLPNCGTLPDFGNFELAPGREYDRYQGVREMMPFAKGVSAKSHDFDAAGNETHTDYRRMLGIVREAGYRGCIGIEYEGEKTPEFEGVRLTKALLERLRAEGV